MATGEQQWLTTNELLFLGWGCIPGGNGEETSLSMGSLPHKLHSLMLAFLGKILTTSLELTRFEMGIQALSPVPPSPRRWGGPAPKSRQVTPPVHREPQRSQMPEPRFWPALATSPLSWELTPRRRVSSNPSVESDATIRTGCDSIYSERPIRRTLRFMRDAAWPSMAQPKKTLPKSK